MDKSELDPDNVVHTSSSSLPLTHSAGDNQPADLQNQAQHPGVVLTQPSALSSESTDTDTTQYHTEPTGLNQSPQQQESAVASSFMNQPPPVGSTTETRSSSFNVLQSHQSHDMSSQGTADHTAPELIPTRPNNNGPFAFTPEELMDLIDPKSPEKLAAYGGPQGILAGLHADPVKGLSTSGNKPLHSVVTKNSEKAAPAPREAATEAPAATPAYQSVNVDTTAVSFEDRVQHFGQNVLPKRKPKSIFQLMWIALQEKILASS
ncbi:hypothetical protein EDD11_009536 [Mortierella claussenii]|nr:hypothetical protein EDD11_009536 [Mortierella claussenii]